MTNQTEERKNQTSASNAAADLLCPGRHLAQRGCPDEKSEYAETGSRIHAALAARSGENNPALPDLTLEEREVFDACREIEKKMVGQFFGTEHPPMKVFREERYWGKSPPAASDGTRFKHSAKPDVIFVAGTRALIAEYKVLFGDVPESERNLQLRDQVVLVHGSFAGLRQEIGAVVIQPHITHNPQICLYTTPDIQRAASEMWARVAQSNDPHSPRVPGDPQCKFCRAKTRCAEYQRWAGAMVPNMASLLDVTVEAWTPEQRTTFCNQASIAQKWLDDCIAAMKKGLTTDESFIPGYRLKPGNKPEKITNPQEAFTRFIALGGKLEQFMTVIAVTKGKLRKIINEVTGTKGMALDKAMEALTEGIVEVKQNQPSLEKVEGA